MIFSKLLSCNTWKINQYCKMTNFSLKLTYEKVLIILQWKVLYRVTNKLLYSFQIIVIWLRKSALRLKWERFTLLHHLRRLKKGRRFLLHCVLVYRHVHLTIDVHHAAVDYGALDAWDAELVVNVLLLLLMWWMKLSRMQLSALILRVDYSRPGYISSHSDLMVWIILHTVSCQVGLSD